MILHQKSFPENHLKSLRHFDYCNLKFKKISKAQLKHLKKKDFGKNTARNNINFAQSRNYLPTIFENESHRQINNSLKEITIETSDIFQICPKDTREYKEGRRTSDRGKEYVTEILKSDLHRILTGRFFKEKEINDEFLIKMSISKLNEWFQQKSTANISSKHSKVSPTKIWDESTLFEDNKHLKEETMKEKVSAFFDNNNYRKTSLKHQMLTVCRTEEMKPVIGDNVEYFTVAKHFIKIGENNINAVLMNSNIINVVFKIVHFIRCGEIVLSEKTLRYIGCIKKNIPPLDYYQTLVTETKSNSFPKIGKVNEYSEEICFANEIIQVDNGLTLQKEKFSIRNNVTCLKFLKKIICNKRKELLGTFYETNETQCNFVKNNTTSIRKSTFIFYTPTLNKDTLLLDNFSITPLIIMKTNFSESHHRTFSLEKINFEFRPLFYVVIKRKMSHMFSSPCVKKRNILSSILVDYPILYAIKMTDNKMTLNLISLKANKTKYQENFLINDEQFRERKDGIERLHSKNTKKGGEMKNTFWGLSEEDTSSLVLSTCNFSSNNSSLDRIGRNSSFDLLF